MYSIKSKKQPGNSFLEDHHEGPVAKAIEDKTAKLPSDIFLWSALATLGASISLNAMGKKHTALVVGQCAAPLLILGLYDKLVKLLGHDSHDKENIVKHPRH